jgi:hypothetical protein
LSRGLAESPSLGYVIIISFVAPGDFEILSSIRNVQVIAVGHGVKIHRRLRRNYGGPRWRKMKGVALIREYNGDVYEAEIHWFEAHGIGRRDWKIKKRFR